MRRARSHKSCSGCALDLCITEAPDFRRFNPDAKPVSFASGPQKSAAAWLCRFRPFRRCHIALWTAYPCQRLTGDAVVQARHSRFVSMHPCGAASSSANVKNIIRSFNHGMPSSLRPHTRHRQATDRRCKDCDFCIMSEQEMGFSCRFSPRSGERLGRLAGAQHLHDQCV
jgi:hypothetical protein